MKWDGPAPVSVRKLPGGYYGLRSVQPLSDFRLLVTFFNGETKVVDIFKMRGDGGPYFEAAFQKFDQVKFDAHMAYWEVFDNTIEIEN